MKIYVKDVRKPNDTLYTFLKRILRLDYISYCIGSCDTTYFNLEFTKVQCNANKYRSFDDIVLISKTYFRVSDKVIAKALKKILDEYHHTSFVLCDTANKWVFYYGLNKSDEIMYCAKYNKSYTKTDIVGKGAYSFNNIITLMGLKETDVKIK